MNERQSITNICILAPTSNLAYAAGNLVVKLNLQDQVSVFESSFERAITEAKNLIAQGAKVIISRKGTYKRVKQYVEIPTVSIETNISDYIPVLKMLSRRHTKTAFFSYDNDDEQDLKSLCDMLRIPVKFYRFADFNDSDRVVLEALNDGNLFGVGGSSTEYFADIHGLEHYTVESSEESILRAISVAQQLLVLREEEQEKALQLEIKNERYDLIFNYTNDAIIAVDEKGKIEVLNYAARQIIDANIKDVVGKPIEDILPNTRLTEVLSTKRRDIGRLMDINGTKVVTNRIPIIVDNVVKGAVATFTDLKTIQSSEMAARQQLSEKGLVASYKFDDIISKSPNMKQTKELAKQYTKNDFTVLIYGETGTGKELFAQSIHNESYRSKGPFVAINCSALSEDLLESELFGYEEGTFTGALKGGKQGLFELANNGTIFLDEIGDIPLRTQVLLLRVIEMRQVRRIGGEKNIPVDIRIICATNKNLLQEIEQGKFREDLYYRLNVLSLMIPPLRKRKADILAISKSILNDLNKAYKTRVDLDFEEIFSQLKNYPWFGNIRELRNFVERCYIVSNSGDSTKEDEQLKNVIETLIGTDSQYSESLDSIKLYGEEERLKILLEKGMSNTEIAKLLGISRTTLWRKMKKYNLEE